MVSAFIFLHLTLFKFVVIGNDFRFVGFDRLKIIMRVLFLYFEEGHRFSRFDVPHWDGMEYLAEAQARNGVMLQAFLRVLDVLRVAWEEKRRHVMGMEVHL